MPVKCFILTPRHSKQSTRRLFDLSSDITINHLKESSFALGVLGD